MKQQIFSRVGWAVLFVFVVFIGDRAGGWLCQQIVKGSGFRYSRMYTDKAKCDILLLGNSRGLGFYQPTIEEITGKKTFNLSYNGMTMDLGKVLVEDYLERYPAPERLVIDVTMCDRSSPEILASFVPYIADSDRLKGLIRDTSYNVAAATSVSHLYRYNSEIFQRALYYSNGKSDNEWLLDRAMSTSTLKHTENQKYRIDARFIKELKATIEYAESKGTEVELVMTPYYPPFAKVVRGLDIFHEDIERGTGRRVRDYSYAIEDPSCFGDFQHLNKKGSKLYMQQLKADGVL